MQRVEPAACLVNTLGNEIGREYGTVVNEFLVLERIVHLRKRHGAAVKPDVYQIKLALHGTACL